MRIATWNLERKKPTSPRGAEAIDHLYAQAADVMVLTEVRTSLPARRGHLLFGEQSEASWLGTDERKVAVWSANVLEPVDVGIPLDPNRFIAARTTTPIGQILVLGVCLPWHMSEVVHRSGPKRKPWEMHLEYLEQLRGVMIELKEPFVVAGDFNQRYPRAKNGNRAAAEAMENTFAGVDIVTSGTVVGCDKPGIDHIAISKELAAAKVEGWRNDVTGNWLSDHDGALADVVLR